VTPHDAIGWSAGEHIAPFELESHQSREWRVLLQNPSGELRGDEMALALAVTIELP
jgi:hypothetical protein